MTKEEIKETLEQQLKVLSERSKSGFALGPELYDLTKAMEIVIGNLRVLGLD